MWGEEAPTKKTLRAIPAEPLLVPCPKCEGSTFQELQPLEPPMLNTYRVIQCQACEGAGMITPEKALEIRKTLFDTES